MHERILIKPLHAGHWPEVRSIYLQGISTGNSTFQQSAPEWEEWDQARLPSCRIVALRDLSVLGWAALSPVSRRPVYSGVAEVSVYVYESARGSGIGSLLLSQLILDSEAASIWTLQAGIFPENLPSLRLHVRAGFRVVGKRERLGCMNDRRRDVLLLERRSSLVGC